MYPSIQIHDLTKVEITGLRDFRHPSTRRDAPPFVSRTLRFHFKDGTTCEIPLYAEQPEQLELVPGE